MWERKYENYVHNLQTSSFEEQRNFYLLVPLHDSLKSLTALNESEWDATQVCGDSRDEHLVIFIYEGKENFDT